MALGLHASVGKALEPKSRGPEFDSKSHSSMTTVRKFWAYSIIAPSHPAVTGTWGKDCR